MKLRLAIAIAALPFAAFPAIANAAPEMTGEQAAELSNAIFTDIQAHRLPSALDKADTLIAAFNARQAVRAHACAETAEQAQALAKRNDAEVTMELTIVGMQWCDGYFTKGFVLIDLGRSNEALPWLQLAHDRAPLNANYTNELAEWFKSQRDWPRSFALFKEALASTETARPDLRPLYKARALRGMGFVKIELGELDEAEKLFNESLTHQPDSTAAKSELKYIRQIRGKPTT